MADLTNRSRHCVEVPRRDDLKRLFPFNKLERVGAYVAELRRANLRPKVSQLDDSWLVRIRAVGQRATFVTLKSHKAAEEFLDGASEASRKGALHGYTAARHITVADLITRYLLEEAPRHKSRLILQYALE